MLTCLGSHSGVHIMYRDLIGIRSPKKDGTHRPVIVLKALNNSVKRQHFKMEGPQLIKDLLQKEDWMLCVEWGSTNTAGTSMFKISHIHNV